MKKKIVEKARLFTGADYKKDKEAFDIYMEGQYYNEFSNWKGPSADNENLMIATVGDNGQIEWWSYFLTKCPTNEEWAEIFIDNIYEWQDKGLKLEDYEKQIVKNLAFYIITKDDRGYYKWSSLYRGLPNFYKYNDVRDLVLKELPLKKYRLSVSEIKEKI